MNLEIHTSSPVQNPSLIVSKIKKDEFLKIKNLVDKWNNEIEKKIEEIEDIPTLNKELDLLDDANTIYSKISANIELLKLNNTNKFKMIKCIDTHHRIQGIAQYERKKNKFSLDYLATKPSNLECSLNNPIKRTKGVGTQIISYFNNKMINKKIKKLCVYPSETSFPFYEKLKFQYINPYYMELSIDEAT
ncbi:MAG: hypothetical protein Q8K60_04915 [Parachlamydiaceae bacterium]|nr:hypothetical protein [Parachlamydiaceae bacterium]